MSSLLARRLSTPRPTLDLLHFAGALLGILVVVHLWIMADRGFDRGCFGFSEPTAFVECEIVTTSESGRLFGVSNAIWGLLFYVAMVALSALAGLPRSGRSPVWRRLRAAALAFGIVYSGYLVVLQATQIGEYCRLCMISAAIVTFLFLLVLLELATEPSADRPPMRKPALFAALGLATVVVAAADLSYFSGLAVVDVAPATETIARAASPAADDTASDGLEPGEESDAEAAPPVAAAASACEWDDSIPPVRDYLSLVTFSDPFLGASTAPVMVYEFFDPNCSHCRRLHPIMKQLAASHGTTARIYPIPFMLWPDRSLLPIEALYVAAQDGKFHEMMEAQFAGATGKGYYTVPELLQMAVDIGLDEASFTERLRRGLNRDAIWSRRVQVAELGIRSTPTVMINGRLVRTKSLDCLIQFVEEAAAG
jgi:uncharacterized membrane protein/predicted DsbA family dithiol-disulfide isomerase